MAERPHPDERDVDAIFESIVAHWDDEAPPTADRLPHDPDHPPEPDRTSEAGSTQTDGPDEPHDSEQPGRPEPHRRTDGDDEPDQQSEAPAAPKGDEGVPWRVDPTNSVSDLLLGDDPGTDDDEEGFTPPPTAPLPPWSDRLFWGALGGLVLGPLGLVWLVLAGGGGWAQIIVFTLIIGGFACLVLRQPTDRGDDDPDNGARV